jgi:hypothetical protein
MPSTYTVNLGIEKPATGEQSGTWGDTVNDNSNILDEAINGVVSITLASAGSSGSPNSITITNGALSTGRNKWIEFTDGGDLGAAAYVQLTPNDAEKICFIRNSLTASRSIFLFQGTYNASNDLEIAAGTDVVVKFNGGGTGATVVNVYANLKVDGIVATTADINGGTVDGTVIGGAAAAALTATTVVANTSLNIAGTTTISSVLDEDNMASDSATALATQQSIKAYVDSQVGTVDTLSEILANGNTTGATDIDVDGAQKVQFRDAAIYINSSVDGQLDIVADTEIQIAATTIDINGAIVASGDISAASLDISGNVDIDGITNLDVVDIDGAVQIDAALTVGVDDTGYDVKFYGATGGAYMLWDESADDLILAGAAGLSVDGTTNLDVVDIDGAVDMASTLQVDGVITTNAYLAVNGTSIGTGGDRWIGADGTTGTWFYNVPTGSNHYFAINNSNKFQINSDGSLSTPTLGTSNVRFGVNAGNSIIAGGNYNTVVGDEAGTAITTGDNNVLIGAFTGDALTTGTFNVAVGTSALGSDILGNRSVAVGNNALTTQNPASAVDMYNVAVGYSAGAAVTTGTQNTLIGGLAGDAITTASDNTALGYASLSENTTGASNTAVGKDALLLNTTASNNTALGASALRLNTTGTLNTAVGTGSLAANTTANYNTAVGNSALTTNTTGGSNTAVGSTSLLSNTTGGQNVALGLQTLYYNTTASNNTAVGHVAMTYNTTGASNVAVGADALFNNTTASNNTAVGYAALAANTTGTENLAVGINALYSNQTGNGITAVGGSTLYNNTVSNNTAVGSGSMYANTTGTFNLAVGAGLYGGAAGTLGANTTGSYNTGLGVRALQANTTASNNTAVGYAAMYNNTASNNTAVGTSALAANTTGAQNTAVGHVAGDALTVGSYNVALGQNALSSDTQGSQSVAIGSSALFTQNFVTPTNVNNTAVGHGAGAAVTTGTANTFIGALAGDDVTTGAQNAGVGYASLSGLTGAASYNVALGSGAGASITSGSNNIAIGQSALQSGRPGGAVTTGSNVIGLGNSDHTSAHIQIDWTVASDARDKTDFTALDIGLDFINALSPLTYRWDKRSKYGDNNAEDYDLNAQTPDGTHKEDWLDIGFKAQEVEALEIAAGYNKDSQTNLISSCSKDGKQMGLQYSKFVPILVKAIQELTARLEALEGAN